MGEKGLGSSGPSSDNNNKHCFDLHLWPVCHFSSQLKQSPFACHARISVGERYLIGKLGLCFGGAGRARRGGGVGKNGGFGLGKFQR